ncbi:MAG TPA: indole-3-glycerol phosphate synthase TrpC [Longimicrobiaceae bacterium]|nr:indole-3-glycerol phosphate synthase TrpC [Longimicrobiaceae bacterium]
MTTSEADILQRIVATKHEEVALLAPRREELRARATDLPPARGFAAALRAPGEVRLLAEIKRKSPTAGAIRPGAEPAEVARAYEAGGAAALSVLTDRRYFDGSLEALATVRAAVGLPLLRKDFVIDPVQVWEARAAGADAVLLIARILDDALLAELRGLATEAGLDSLVEVHDAEELERALAAGAPVVGVNNRDLRTFTTEISRTLGLAPAVPAGVTLVAESGIRTAEDVRRLGAAGVDAVLVGESLMRQPDVTAAAAALAGQPKRGRGAA